MPVHTRNPQTPYEIDGFRIDDHAYRARKLERRHQAAKFQIKITNEVTAPVVGDGGFIMCIPDDILGKIAQPPPGLTPLTPCAILSACGAFVSTVGTTTTTIQIRNVTTGLDMLSTLITIDASKHTSYESATQPIINYANFVVAVAHLIAIDIDTVGTGAMGLGVSLAFR